VYSASFAGCAAIAFQSSWSFQQFLLRCFIFCRSCLTIFKSQQALLFPFFRCVGRVFVPRLNI